MAASYTAVIQQSGDWWIGWVGKKSPGQLPGAKRARNWWKIFSRRSERRWEKIIGVSSFS